MSRLPGFKILATHARCSERAFRKNAVFMSEVTQYSDVPRRVITARHIATSAAPIIVIPLTMPPGRSMVETKATRSVHSPGALAVTVKPYGLRNSADARTSLSS